MWINDELWEREYRSPQQSLPSVGKRFLKANRFSWNEIAAYQVAEHLSLPIPKVDYFVTERSLLIDDVSIPPGAVCLLLDDVKPKKLYPIATAPCSLELKSHLLAFFVFNGGSEWPEIWECDQGFVILDLERQFPCYHSDSMTREHRLQEYRNTILARKAVGDCSYVAYRSACIDDFVVAGLKMMRALEDEFAPDFTPCQRGDEIGAFFSHSISVRLAQLKEFIEECGEG